MAISRFSDEQRAERRDFLERRQGGIGGSDLPKILGLSSYGNALDVYYEKVRPITEEMIEDDSIHQLRGHALEDMALAHYWVHTGRRGRKTGVLTSHPEYPNVIVRRDFEVFADEGRPEPIRGTGTGEIKSPVSYVFGKIIDDGLRESEIVQLQTNIAASRHGWGTFCYFNLEHSDGPVKAVDLVADPDLGQFCLEAGQRFWDEHVVPRIPPDPHEWARLREDPDAPPIYDLSGEVYSVPDDDLEYRAALARELELKDLKNEAEEAYRAQQSLLFRLTVERGYQRAHAPAVGKVTMVTRKGSESFLKDTLANALPLDRDKVESFLREHMEEVAEAVAEGGNIQLTPEAIGEMLFRCTLDLDLFRTVGNPSQFIRTSRSNDV